MRRGGLQRAAFNQIIDLFNERWEWSRKSAAAVAGKIVPTRVSSAHPIPLGPSDLGTSSGNLLEILVPVNGIGFAAAGRMSEAILSPPSPVHSVFVEEASRILGVSRRTVYYRIREGKLRTMRTRCGSSRVLLESIESLLREDAAKRRARTLRTFPSEAEPLALEVESFS